MSIFRWVGMPIRAMLALVASCVFFGFFSLFFTAILLVRHLPPEKNPVYDDFVKLWRWVWFFPQEKEELFYGW